MRPLREASDQIQNHLPWEYQMIMYFRKMFMNLKEKDDFKILTLDTTRLTQDFINNYSALYDDISSKLEKPDRHKIIAMLTKAFLDAAPFGHNGNIVELIKDKRITPYRLLVFPNEVLALDICKMILTKHGQILKQNSDYDFVMPSNTYVYASCSATSDYEYELYLIYRHYANALKKGKGKFSIYQMAHIYFLLEMGCDIAKYDAKLDYYT